MILIAWLLAAGSQPDPARCVVPENLDGAVFMTRQDSLKRELDVALAAHGRDAEAAKTSLDAIVACYQPTYDAMAAKLSGPLFRDVPKDLRSSIERNGNISPPPPRIR